MCSYTKLAAGWLRPVVAEAGQEYTLTAVEHQHMGDGVLRVDADAPLGPEGGAYYLIEARDGDAPCGAPESGVMIYYVIEAGQVHVRPPTPEVSGTPRWGATGYVRPTLHSAADAGGAHAYTLPIGIRVELVREALHPYRPTIRFTRVVAGG